MSRESQLLRRLFAMLTDRAPSFTPFNVTVDSQFTCPVYVAYDLSGSSFRVCQPRADMVSRAVGLGATIGGTSAWVGPLQLGWARPVSISPSSAC